MSFLAPLYLLLGAAAAVPLLLHLLRRNVTTRVDFPAARYLQRAEREHSRSLRLRNLLLMLMRLLLLLALALAAARPFVRGLGVGHGATAVGIVLDNSLSTTAVTGGVVTFERLRLAARALVRAATIDDRLWLATADGRVRAGTRDALLAELATISTLEDAGDLPLALRRASAAVQASGLPSKIVAVTTDGQRVAWRRAARGAVGVAVLVPAGAPPINRAVTSVQAEPIRWTPRGTLTAHLDAADTVGYRIVLGERTIARGSAGRGEPVTLRVAPTERGWQSGRIELEPDDYRADDARAFAVWIGPPPRVSSDSTAGVFASTALATLIADGRAEPGADVRIVAADVATRLPALLLPPIDPMRLGAANRSLARLGVPWRFGVLDRSATVARGPRVDGVAVTERYRLMREGAAAADTLATAGGEPWAVAGAGYVVLASRLDPATTALPVRAAFVPWLADVVTSRLATPAGDAALARAVRPGAPVVVPEGVSALENASGARRAISGTMVNAPAERGVWFLVRDGRRIGALVVEAPPEESVLARWSAGELASRLAGRSGRAASSADAWVRDTFAAGTRRPAATSLLVFALLVLVTEAVALRTSRSTAA